MPQVGDFVARGDPLFRIRRGGRTVDVNTLHSSIVVGSERTMEQDPRFALYRWRVGYISYSSICCVCCPTGGGRRWNRNSSCSGEQPSGRFLMKRTALARRWGICKASAVQSLDRLSDGSRREGNSRRGPVRPTRPRRTASTRVSWSKKVVDENDWVKTDVLGSTLEDLDRLLPGQDVKRIFGMVCTKQRILRTKQLWRPGDSSLCR